MKNLWISTARILRYAAGTTLIAGPLLLCGCTTADGSLELLRAADADEKLAETVENDPFPTAAELGVAANAK